ncbi:MAG: pyroglutamyl-peptidase I [Planctomycetes bacterium]|nr:pyroglutamyl-peptidase I [Planctomycetota bacterium]
MQAPTILVTGFEPFGGESINPSAEIARRLDGGMVEGRRVAGRVLSCAFGRAREELLVALADVAPVLVVALGQAGGRREVSLERVAINVDDARIADNAGAQPIDRPVVAGGPVAYWSTLPIKAIVAALRAAGLPAAVSQSAGTFVCNHLFFGLMHALERRPAARGGFVHVPWLPEQAARHPGEFALPLADQLRAIELVIATALKTPTDAALAGGALS